VWLTPETCRVNLQINRLLCVAFCWTIINILRVLSLSDHTTGNFVNFCSLLLGPFNLNESFSVFLESALALSSHIFSDSFSTFDVPLITVWPFQLRSFLSAFAKLRKETISFAISVCPSAWNGLTPPGRTDELIF